MGSSERRTDRLLAGIVTVASLAFIVAVNWLPWATFKSGFTVRFMAGERTPYMNGIGLAVIALTGLTLRRASKVADWLLVGLTIAGLAIAVALALHSISSANSLHDGILPTTTAYGAGSLVGVVAALVMLIVVTVRLAVAANDTEVHPSAGITARVTST